MGTFLVFLLGVFVGAGGLAFLAMFTSIQQEERQHQRPASKWWL